MDFSYPIQPHFYFVPSNFKWGNVVTGETMSNPYSFMGIGQILSDVFSFYDGINEHGLAAAALYFAGYAHYHTKEQNPDAQQIASYDFLQYILANCKSVADLCTQVKTLRIVGVTDPLTETIAPLHWIVTDRSGKCVVLEQTEEGIILFNNPLGILANSPDFRWQMTNLRNYTNVTPQQEEEVNWDCIQLTPFGQAGGTAALPGGYTSPERFVRTAYLKTHMPAPSNPKSACVSFFQIMKSVSVPKGSVITARQTDDYTQYTAFINTQLREYSFTTYDNLQILKVRFPSPSSTSLMDLGSLVQPMTYEYL